MKCKFHPGRVQSLSSNARRAEHIDLCYTGHVQSVTQVGATEINMWGSFVRRVWPAVCACNTSKALSNKLDNELAELMEYCAMGVSSFRN